MLPRKPAMTIHADADTYGAWLREAHLDAPWLRPGPLIHQKASTVQPCLWRWADIEPRLRRTPEFVAPGHGAERRILRLDNPGVPDRTATHTLSVAVQYLLPGETAPVHRHTPNALRFMVKGEGAYTIVEGQRCDMAPGDLVLTPCMTWHEHGNAGSGPVMWIDGLDSPVVRYLELLLMQSPAGAEGAPAGRVAPGRVIHYRWDDACRALLRQAEIGGTSADDVIVEYLDPTTGQPVLPTIGCALQMLRPGVITSVHRHASCAVYHVVRGRGSSTIGEVTYEWEAGDCFAVPPMAPHAHRQAGRDPAILFSMTDAPLLRALGHYREA